MEEQPNKVQLHEQICQELKQIYQRKNERYGDSYAKLRRDLGRDSILYRVGDKYHRLQQLLRNPWLSHDDESIDDTLMDLANYCIMELVERQVDKHE